MLRASDEDREQAADRLRRATAEGRLLAEELEERLGTVFRARTYGELDAAVADLPAPRADRRPRPRPAQLIIGVAAAVIAVTVVLAVLAAVVFIVTGVLAAWLLWLAVAWWLFGHKRRLYYVRRRGYLPRRF